MVPLLLNGIPNTLVPAPDLVRVPAFVKVPSPPGLSKVSESCTSIVPTARLFSVAPASELRTPPLHTMAPELLIVPFWNVLADVPLIFNESPAAIVVVPKVFNAPPVHSRESTTEILAVPAIVPPVRRRKGGAVSVELKVTLPPDTTTLSVAVTVPLSVWVPLSTTRWGNE